MSRTALITGITGQDGSYLAELLLEKGYTVHGIRRSASLLNLDRLTSGHRLDPSKLKLHYGDVTDSSNMRRILEEVRPRELYHLAAQSHVKVSFDMPEYTANVDAVGTLRLLDSVRAVGMVNEVRFYQASTSELYGNAAEVPQTETTPFRPRSPYAAAKLYAHWTVVNYREAYGLHASNGILFNHESPRRGLTFVTRKITSSVARMKHGSPEVLAIGNLDARRDWGYAPEYVAGMWQMLQQPQAGDYVLATGKTHSVREFVDLAFQLADLPLQWEGSGTTEVGRLASTGEVRVRVDPWYYRPTEVDLLLGDARRAREVLGWAPSTTFSKLVEIMVRADLDRVAAGESLR